MLGELTRLKIEGFKKIDCNESDKVREFTVMFNPSTYSQKYEIDYDTQQGAGTTGNTQKFGSIKPKDYTFELMFDGTGTSSEKVDVSQVLDDFLTTTAKMDGDIHRPLFLKLSWGDLIVKCVLKSADITYILFSPDGKPIRAKVNAAFSENIPEEVRVAEEGKSSPDLTHQRQVKAQDYITLMSDKLYGDFKYYVNVAKANNLNNFRKLETGNNIKFPPLVNK